MYCLSGVSIDKRYANRRGEALFDCIRSCIPRSDGLVGLQIKLRNPLQVASSDCVSGLRLRTTADE
jgi:hypothetical protein